MAIETETLRTASRFCLISSRYIDGFDSRRDLRYRSSSSRIWGCPARCFEGSVYSPSASWIVNVLCTTPTDTFRRSVISRNVKCSCHSWTILCFMSRDNAGVMIAGGIVISNGDGVTLNKTKQFFSEFVRSRKYAKRYKDGFAPFHDPD